MRRLSDLSSAVQWAETGVLRATAGLVGWEDLRRELLAMGRQGGVEHDDLVFALALGALGHGRRGWLGGRCRGGR